jgi:hypothetical protein
MSMFKKLALTAAALGSLAAATPSQAVITTFAAFNPISTVRNVRWVRSGTSNGQLYTTNNGVATAPGTANVRFSFLQPYFVSNDIAQNITARFTLNATTVADPATITNGTVSQQIDGGSFSFLSTTAITVGNTTYAAGSNLLSGTFTNATLSGQNGGTAAGIEDSGVGVNGLSQVNFTSDFLDFNASNSPTIRRDFALALTAINPVLLRATAGQSVRSFRASASGNFSSDPAPMINGVPEPAVWGMMIAGFGAVGFQSRRRRTIKTVTA